MAGTTRLELEAFTRRQPRAEILSPAKDLLKRGVGETNGGDDETRTRGVYAASAACRNPEPSEGSP